MTNTQVGIFDPSELAKLIGDDPIELKEFTQNYREILVEHSKQILQAIEDDDWGSMVFLAHRLKSSSRSMGAFDLGNCCESLEHLGKAGSGSLPEEQVIEFKKLVPLVLEAIDNYLQS